MNLREIISAYTPACEQEVQDRRMMLKYMDLFDDLLTRENEMAHFTASAWVTNPAHDRILMLYHNIYDSWAWPGGHADGEEDLLKVAIKEVQEETGLKELHPAKIDPISLEILTVNAHVKRGRHVCSHLHLNLTYLLEADEGQFIHSKPDENSGVKWFSPEEAVAASSEPPMRIIYAKLNQNL